MLCRLTILTFRNFYTLGKQEKGKSLCPAASLAHANPFSTAAFLLLSLAMLAQACES